MARAIEKLADAFMEWIKGADARRLRNGVDIADRIFKRYREVTPIDRRDKYIEKWIDSFYNRMV
ncbi:MAG: hypothetical protein EOL91_10660 [Actinobacteria bacterium]|nr:hypothetical protein [Actinomycetota bacterium]